MPRLHPRLTGLWRDPISPSTYRTITAAALVALIAIVVSGAAVRLTGSGMGCPTWPTCEDGSLVPRGATGANGWIEFLNRVFTGLVSVAVALAVLGARRRVPYRPDLTRWAWGLVAGVFAQALLGGLVVALHVAPLAVAGHYLLSAVLVANAVILHHKAGEPEGEPGGRRHAVATPAVLRGARALVVLAGLVLLTGTLVTGSGPHSGDEAADRLPFAVVTVARVHSATVWVFLVVVVAVLRRATSGDADPSTIGRGRVLVGAIVAQGALGYVQYAAGVPEALVAAHVLGSVLVWVATLRFYLALTQPRLAGSTTESPPVVGAVAAAPS
ncbi:MAG: COX15/CtaA family protein [Acidimicrobiales bacterium]